LCRFRCKLRTTRQIIKQQAVAAQQPQTNLQMVVELVSFEILTNVHESWKQFICINEHQSLSLSVSLAVFNAGFRWPDLRSVRLTENHFGYRKKISRPRLLQELRRTASEAGAELSDTSPEQNIQSRALLKTKNGTTSSSPPGQYARPALPPQERQGWCEKACPKHGVKRLTPSMV
jgi:hypothetical protein